MKQRYLLNALVIASILLTVVPVRAAPGAMHLNSALHLQDDPVRAAPGAMHLNSALHLQDVAAAVEGPVCSMCTASALQLHPCSMFCIDAEAAGMLKMREYYEWVQARKSSAPA